MLSLFAFDEKVKLENPEKTSGDWVENQQKLPHLMVPIVVYKKWDTLISNLKYNVTTQILIYCRDEKLKYLRMLPPLQYLLHLGTSAGS